MLYTHVTLCYMNIRVCFNKLHIACINLLCKIYQQLTKHFNFMMYFYLYYVQQHVSASNPTIFRAMCVLRVLNNNYYYQHTNRTRCLPFKRHNIFLSYFPYQFTLTFCSHYATVAALASPRSLP
jgi:hypothetical protein